MSPAVSSADGLAGFRAKPGATLAVSFSALPRLRLLVGVCVVAEASCAIAVGYKSLEIGSTKGGRR
jgi:hypothetical protein